MLCRSCKEEVVDAGNADVAAWWVNVRHPDAMSRMRGAWAVGPGDAVTRETLTFDRVVWPTAADSKVLADAGVQPRCRSEFPAASNLDVLRPRGKAKRASGEMAVSFAQRLADWCVQWKVLEATRLSRPLLSSLDEAAARPLPVVTR
jgi:hypothetical protein